MPNKNSSGKAQTKQTDTIADKQSTGLQTQDQPIKTGDTLTPETGKDQALGHGKIAGLTRAGLVDSNRKADLLAQAGQGQTIPNPTASSKSRSRGPGGDDLRQAERIAIGGTQSPGAIQVQHSVPVVRRDIDRVRAYSDPAVNALIDEGIRERLQLYAGQPATVISKRIAELDQEWDIERFMAVKASSLAMIGLVLGIVRARRWLLLPLLALPMLFQHSSTGTCLTTPWARRMGFRTRHEIEAEKYALKVLRGDFGDLDVPRESAVEHAINAVKH